MRPRIGSRFLEGLLYALTAFAPFAFGCVEPWALAVLEVFVFLLAFACFMGGRRAASPAGALFWLFPAAFAAFGALQLQAQTPPDFPFPAAPFTVAPHATAAAVTLWLAYAALLWSVPRIIITHNAARRYVRFLLWLGIAVTALGIAQKLTGGDKIYWTREAAWTSFFGPYYNRDHAASLLLMSFGVGLGVLWGQVRRAQPYAWTAGGLLVLFAGLVLCGSRSAFLAMPLAGALLCLLGAGFERKARDRRAIAAAAIAAAAVVVLLAFRHVSSGVDAGARMDRAVAGRFSIYGDAARWWRDAPLFGTGLGSFRTTYPAYQDLDLRAYVEHAHSDWLEIALEAGLSGLLAALASAGLGMFFAARAWRRARSSEMRGLIGGALASAAAFFVQGLFDFSFQIPANAAVLMGLAGFLLSAPGWADKSGDVIESQPPASWEFLAAAACFLTLAATAVTPALAAYRAAASGSFGVKAAAMLEAWSQDDDPKYLQGAALNLYAATAATDPALLRASLSYALAAAQSRPFDNATLQTAGRHLLRLARPADAAVFFERAELVRFAAVRPVRR